MFEDLTEKIEEQLLKGLPLVVYKKPDSKEVVAVFQNDASLNYAVDFTEKGFVFAPYNSEQLAILLRLDKLVKFSYSSTDNNRFYDFDLPEESENTKLSHINLVCKGLKEIKKGKFKKVMLSRKIKQPCSTAPLQLFQELINTYKNAFCYFWHHPKVGTWLGATPELLLKKENRQITTMSLAGTQPVKSNDNPIWKYKEIEEQRLVTEYISSVLETKVINLNISKVESVKAGNLWHLRTSISGQIKMGGLKELLCELDPTPAVCGLPKETAEEFIKNNENYDREYYTGFLGELNFKEEYHRSATVRNPESKACMSVENKTELFVNLRCMKLENNIASIYVGGGITTDSDPEREWKETVDKSATLLKIIFNSH